MDVIVSWSKKFNICVSCGSTNYQHKAKGLCTFCYNKIHEYPKCKCSICGNIARVHSRDKGNAICKKCYKEPSHICSICNKNTSAALKLSAEEYVCDNCYTRHYRKKHLCTICGKEEILAVNSKNKHICINCYKYENQLCTACGRSVPSPYLINNAHVCIRCYENRKKNSNNVLIEIASNEYSCSICGINNVVQRVYNDGSSICPICFKNMAKACSSCQNAFKKTHSHIEGLPYCRSCYYHTLFQRIFSQMKESWDETFSEIVLVYFESKAAVTSYETVYTCFKQKLELFDLLHASFIKKHFTFESNEIYQILIERSCYHPFLNDFVAFLTTKKLISGYDSAFNLLNNLEHNIEFIIPAFKKVLLAYKDYLTNLVYKYREKGWVGEYAKFNYYTSYLYMLTAVRFFSHIQSELGSNQVSEIDNNTVDSYLKQKPYENGNLRHLIKYLNSTKLIFARLSLPRINCSINFPMGLNEDSQIIIFNRCASDITMSLRDRTLILIMLLFGLTPQDVRLLRKNNIIKYKQGQKNMLLLSYSKVEYQIPNPLLTMIDTYYDSLCINNDYIFPGRLYNTPLSLSSIWSITKKYGITPMDLYYTAVNNAIINGLNQPALLMKSFNICSNTATKYYKFIDGCYKA